MPKNELDELSEEEKKLEAYWNEVLINLKDRNGRIDLGYIWTDEVKKGFEGIKKELGKITFILGKLHVHYKTDKKKYNKEINDIRNLLRYISKIKPTAEWVKQVLIDLQQIVSDVESEKLGKIALNISYKLGRELIRNFFPDIPSHRIFVHIFFVEESKEIPGWFTQKDPLGYTVTGPMPMSLIKLNNYESILKGLLGHEFSHIVLGHNDGLRNRVYGFFSKRFRLFGSRITGATIGAMEKAADKETIRRGLGKELYQSTAYFESLAKQYGKEKERYQSGRVGYTSEQIKALINEK
ncbi:hypothetical protein HYT53_03010 [Candidatus Woesearchaeota archaeon]|nr:hypothetical protein [Candidatus Woesearchaeota archaeon]